MNASSQVEPTIQQLFDLTGRSALITGATGWLGASMARALAEAGCDVVVSSRDRTRAQAIANTLPSIGQQRHYAVELDHMEVDSINRGFADALAATHGIDILVNNGLEIEGGDLTNVTFDEFHRHQRNNAGYFELARNVRDHALAAGRPASIVMIGSMYGRVGSYPDAYQGVGPASPVAYHVLKGGTLQMARHLAVYWAKDNVRVNCLSPGPFPKDDVPEELVRRLEAKNPMGRMGRPHELKGALLLLASDAGSYISGQNIVVDGGWTAW